MVLRHTIIEDRIYLSGKAATNMPTVFLKEKIISGFIKNDENISLFLKIIFQLLSLSLP